MTNGITKKALDALAVSPEMFVFVAKQVLDAVKGSELGAIPLAFGHTEETKRIAGTIYVVPSSKRRAAFPVLWDTEPRKYLYPQLFQALNGPDWSDSFNATFEKNGTVNLTSDLLSDEADAGLPELIDAYLKARLEGQGSKTLLIYRPAFSSVDRFQAAYVEKSDDIAVTNYMKELYGFYPQMDLPLMLAIKATDGLADSSGLPQVKTAANASIFRYVAAESLKEAKKKTRLYASYATASDYAPEKEWPIFRVSLDEGKPDWSTVREVHSAADDLASKTASHTASAPWLDTLVALESRRMAYRLKSALTNPGQKVVL